VAVLERPGWAADPSLEGVDGRRRAQDQLDAGLARWAADRDLDDAVARLIACGVPAAPVVDSRLTSGHPQLQARQFYETVDHPVVGSQPLSTVPFRFASQDRLGRPWLRRPAPLLGEHNREILQGILGLNDDDVAALEADGVIGTAPVE
jgi:crotonobetainyl-CoA:carnitine CoA-transferase CaiB-like acyl-CoA transferase